MIPSGTPACKDYWEKAGEGARQGPAIGDVQQAFPASTLASLFSDGKQGTVTCQFQDACHGPESFLSHF